MSFADSFRAGREAARAARRRSPRPPGPPAPDHPTGGGKPSPIKIGYYCPLESDEAGGPLLSHTERHVLLLGLNGAGKSTRFLIELLMSLVGRSLWVFDIKGELAYQTAA